MLTIDDLRKTVEYQSLTPKQQAFIDAYVANGHDVVAAVRTAYGYKAEVARIHSYRVIKSPAVLICLAAYAGSETDPKEPFKQLLWKNIVTYGKRLTSAQVDALRLYAQVNGWHGKGPVVITTPKLHPADPEKPKPEDTPKKTLLDEF